MEKQKKVFKNEIKYLIQLNEEQKEAKALIRAHQIVVITGRAGCGKSLVSAQTALDFIFKKEYESIYVHVQLWKLVILLAFCLVAYLKNLIHTSKLFRRIYLNVMTRLRLRSWLLMEKLKHYQIGRAHV